MFPTARAAAESSTPFNSIIFREVDAQPAVGRNAAPAKVRRPFRVGSALGSAWFRLVPLGFASAGGMVLLGSAWFRLGGGHGSAWFNWA